MDNEIFNAEPPYRFCSGASQLSIVDSHVHIWAPHKSTRPWPRPETAKPHKAYLGVSEYGMTKQMLIAAMDGAGVDRAILIPPSWEGHYNDLALDAVASFPHRFAVMGRLNLEQPMSDAQFRQWWGAAGLLGLRCIFHSPRYQALLVRGDFDWLWPLAEKYAVPISLMMPGMYEAAGLIEQLLTRYPNLKLTLDHINIHCGDKTYITKQVNDFASLTRFSGFALKASAVPSWSGEPYPYADTSPYLKQLFDAFGPKRLFWGSDFTRLNVNYRSAVSQFIEELDWIGSDDLPWIMGRGISEWLGWSCSSH